MDLNSRSNTEFLESVDNNYLQRLTAAAFKLDFALPPDVLAYCEQLYAPLRFNLGTNAPTDHPLGATHLRVASNFASKYAIKQRNFIEIGPNILTFSKYGKNPESHGCCLYGAPRDDSRFRAAASSPKIRTLQRNDPKALDFFDSVQLLASGLNSKKFCVNGFENCEFQAPVAIAVHSLYDINFAALATGMERHGMHVIKAWMHFPIAALQVDKYTDLRNQVRHITYKHKGQKRIKFAWLNDASFVYDHDFDTWMNYLLVGGFETPYGFNVLVEKTKHWGTHFELSITRTNNGGRIMQIIPGAFSNAVRVPNVMDLAKHNFCPKHPIKFIHTDRDKVSKLYYYLSARVEKSFSPEIALAYARSELRAVKLGAVVIDERWDVDLDDFMDIAVSVYIMALIQKRKMNLAISLTTKHIDKLMKKPTWLQSIFADTEFGEFLANIRHNFSHLFGGDCQTPFILSAPVAEKLSAFIFKFYDDIETEDLLTEFRTRDAINFSKFYSEHIDEILPILPTPTHHTDLEETYVVTPSEFVMPDQEATRRAFIEDLTNVDPSLPAELKDVLQSCADVMRDFHTDFVPSNTNNIFGVPGSGKTRLIMTKTIPHIYEQDPKSKVILIAPTRNLKSDHIGKLTHYDVKGVSCFTPHTGMLSVKKFPKHLLHIFVDECFTFDLPYLAYLQENCAKLYLLGDVKQIGRIDFTNEEYWANLPRLVDVYDALPHLYMPVSHRIPQDVCALPIIRSTYPGIKTTSKIQRSICYTTGGVKPKKGHKVITFLQEQKNLMSALSERPNTAHELQGATFENAFLQVGNSMGEKQLLRNSPNHVVVALTRHTKQLVIHEDTPGDLLIHINTDVRLATILEPSNVIIEAPIFEQPEAPALAMDVCLVDVTDSVQFTPAPVISNAVESILQTIYPTNPEIQEYAGVTTSNIPNHEGATGIIRPDVLLTDDTLESKVATTYRFPQAQRVKVTQSKNKNMTLFTLMERYSKKTKNMTGHSCKLMAAKLYKGLKKHINFDAPHDIKEECYADAIKKFTERGGNLDDLEELPASTFDKANMQIKFNMKQQQKPDLSTDPLSKLKAGQGIAAWGKTLNLWFVVWTRILEKVFARNTKSKLHLSTGFNNEEILSMLEAVGSNDPSLIYAINDFEEFDSSQNNVGHELLRMVLRDIGTPEEMLDMFVARMYSRVVTADVGSLNVKNKKDSGRVDTLIDNSLFNVAVLIYIIDWDQSCIDHIFFKGDDSLIIGRKIVFKAHLLQDLRSKCGYKLKLGRDLKSAEYVSFLVNYNGAAIDIPKLAAKVATRHYTNFEDFEKYQIAVKDMIKTTNCTTRAAMYCNINAIHHNSTPEKMDTLLSFLHTFANGDINFSELVPFSYKIMCFDDPNYRLPDKKNQMRSSAKLARRVFTSAGRLLL